MLDAWMLLKSPKKNGISNLSLLRVSLFLLFLLLIKLFSCFYGFEDFTNPQNPAEDKDDDEIGYYGWIDSQQKIDLECVFASDAEERKILKKTETDFSRKKTFFDENDWHISRIYWKKKGKNSVERLENATKNNSMKFYNWELKNILEGC